MTLSTGRGGGWSGEIGPLRERLREVYWVGGAPGAGKSTVAARLAAARGLRCVSTDDSMRAHARRCDGARCPLMREFVAMDMDQRWLLGSPQVMLARFPWFAGEAFDLVVEDLLALPARQGVLVEGLRVLPSLVAPLLTDGSRAVWLLPTPAFRRAALAARGDTWTLAGRTSDPPQALWKLAERDRLFGQRLAGEVRQLGLRSITVEVGMGEEELAALVAAGFGW